MKSGPRVRFAPSPTGELHVGGARTALFNYLFARQGGGKFFLRIEDTDAKRSKQQYVDQICDSLRWLQLEWDGPIVFQSRRREYQANAVQQLLREGRAYRCFCTVEELQKEREEAVRETKGYRYSGKCRSLSMEKVQARLNSADPFCVRIRIPDGKTSFNDLIYGPVTVSNQEIDDFIVQRTDGSPTYNLTVVADDSDMEITHVIRGEDHLTNTPKQIVIYELMGRMTPAFAHLPMILGPDRKRLSKRHGAVGVHEFRNRGYLPVVLLNYLALLGWNPDTGEEVFSLDELKRSFRIEQVQRNPAIYDERKLEWLSGQHMVRASARELLNMIHQLDPDWWANSDEEYLLTVIDIQKRRVKTVTEIMTQSDFLFEDPATYDSKTVEKRWKDSSVNSLVESFVERLSLVEDWTEEQLESEVRRLSEDRAVKVSDLIHATRLALSGVPHGPSLFLMMEVLGKRACLRRLGNALIKLPQSRRPVD